MTSALPSADCLVPLERIVAFIPGADLDYALHIINKDLSVSNMSRKQRPLAAEITSLTGTLETTISTRTLGNRFMDISTPR